MKICAYVQEAYAKTTYKNECMDTRQFVGLRIIINELEKSGYTVDYAGIATVHQYDVVLVSITAFCDWWTFIAERVKWQKGNYKVLVGGAGCLNVEPFLPWFYAAMIGRGENLIAPLVNAIADNGRYEHSSIVYADTFSPDKIYTICQAEKSYEDGIQLYKGEPWREGSIGCNHKCFFCSYSWSRKRNMDGAFAWDMQGGTQNMSDKECALLDYESGAYNVDFKHIRTTAIDGCSQRLRFLVGKPIKDATIQRFINDACSSDSTPHLIRVFNIVGFPTENKEDYEALIETFRKADEGLPGAEKKWLFCMQHNHFIPYPATPLACAPMQYKDYTGGIASELGLTLTKKRLYYGHSIDLLESWTIEGLPQIAMNAIVARGTIADSDSIARIATSKKYANAKKDVKLRTLEKYFNIEKIFGAFTPETLPTRWLHTYAPVEKAWSKTKIEKEYLQQTLNGVTQ